MPGTVTLWLPLPLPRSYLLGADDALVLGLHKRLPPAMRLQAMGRTVSLHPVFKKAMHVYAACVIQVRGRGRAAADVLWAA